MKRALQSEKILLFSYFSGLIVAGTLALLLPFAWGGEGRLPVVDALFTATSAVCVTGLITVDTSQYTRVGQVVIMTLIQAGGLGIISFATVYLARRRGRISLIRRGVIRSYYLESVEHEPVSIVERIVVMTLGFEALGTILLFFEFSRAGAEAPGFTALFHSVSAFCNAGFSLFPNSLEDYAGNPAVSLTVMALIVLGGLGFVALQDVAGRLAGRRRRLGMHARIVLVMSGALILLAAALYLLFEHHRAYASLRPAQKVLAAFFQAVTPRTAGFDTVAQSRLSSPGRTLTILLMFVGGASGSIAGGIKVTTAFVILMVVFRGPDSRGEITAFRRKIGSPTIYRAIVFAFRALFILFGCIFLLTVTEMWLGGARQEFFPIVFESFSAFGTVGLSLGVTPGLSAAGKLVIVLTMFLGRVGLLALAMPQPRQVPVHLLDYPQGEVMIG